MSITYNEIQLILMNDEFAELIPDGMVLSEPVISKRKGKDLDNFFVMKRTGKGTVPVYKFGICVKDKTIEYVEKYNDVNIAEVTKGAGLTMAEYREYTELYGKIRDMFLSRIAVDKEMLGRYMTCFFKMIDGHLLRFYSELSPAFFEFLRENLLR